MVTDTRTKLGELADWIEGCLRETYADLLQIVDRGQRRTAYVAAGDLLIDRALQRGMGLSIPQPGDARLAAHGLTVEGPSLLVLALFQTWHDEARQLLFRDLLDA